MSKSKFQMPKPKPTTSAGWYKEAQDMAIAKAAPRQKSYEEIPKFPYGYRAEKSPPGTGLSFGSKVKPTWAPKNFKQLHLEFGFLPSNPSQHQLKNLFRQVRQYYAEHSPLSLYGKTNTDGVHTTRYIIPQSDPEARADPKAESENPKDDSFYIVRVRTHRMRKRHWRHRRVYMEFLFRLSDNYLIAWRIVKSLDEFKTAYWVCFYDTEYLKDLEPFKGKCFSSRYGSGYGEQLAATNEGRLFFHILFVLFGECPRFAPLDENTAGQITKRDINPLGTGRFFDLVKSWKKLSATLFLLKLMLVEEAIVHEVEKEKPLLKNSKSVRHAYQDVFDEAILRKETVTERFDKLFKDCKELDQFPALNKDLIKGNLGYTTVQLLTTNFLKLLKYDTELVPALLVRLEGYRGKLGLRQRDPS